jgi:hypothetical protein
MFHRELSIALKNVHVSRAVSSLPYKSSEYNDFLEIFTHKYGIDTVKAALNELYHYKYNIADIKRLTAAKIIKNYSI